jgi:hypothetical protein
LAETRDACDKKIKELEEAILRRNHPNQAPPKEARAPIIRRTANNIIAQGRAASVQREENIKSGRIRVTSKTLMPNEILRRAQALAEERASKNASRASSRASSRSGSPTGSVSSRKAPRTREQILEEAEQKAIERNEAIARRNSAYVKLNGTLKAKVKTGNEIRQNAQDKVAEMNFKASLKTARSVKKGGRSRKTKKNNRRRQ